MKYTIGFYTACLVGAILMVPACNSEENDKSDAQDDETSSSDSDEQRDRGENDTATDKDASADADSDSDTDADADGDSDSDTRTDTETESDVPSSGSIENDFGFEMRVPKSYTLTCSGTSETVELEDADHICTFDYGGVTGYVYLQATPVGCTMLMGPVPEFEAGSAYINVDEVTSALGNPSYDRGGNHVNDAFMFDYGGIHYKYYHSSFGFGWRACHPMDCLQILDDDGLVIEDGCTSDRTLPIVCLLVEEGESYGADDFTDTFEKCLGDDS